MLHRTLNNEKELLQNIKEGDQQAFARLYDLLKSKVFSVAYHLVKSPYAAEEITQEVFVSIWVSRAGLHKVENIDAYLYTATYNKSLQWLKKEKNQEEILRWAMQLEAELQNPTEQTLIFREAQRSLHQAVEQLPPQKKIIYRLSKEQGFSNKEIAEQLNISPNTVKNHLVEAVKLLKVQLRHLPVSAAILQGIELFLKNK